MSELPDFDQPRTNTEPSPKKPRRKPMRRKVVKKKAAVKASKPKAEQHAGGRFTVEAYRLIGELMGLAPATRSIVLGVVQGLTNGRAS